MRTVEGALMCMEFVYRGQEFFFNPIQYLFYFILWAKPGLGKLILIILRNKH